MKISRFTLYFRGVSLFLFVMSAVTAYRYWGEGWREMLGAALFGVFGVALWLVGGQGPKSGT